MSSKHFHSCEKCNYKFTCNVKPCNICLENEIIICLPCYIDKVSQFGDKFKNFNHLIKSNMCFVVPNSFFYSFFFQPSIKFIIFS